MVRILVFVVAFVIATAVLLGNWLLARRRAIRDTSPFNPQFLTSRGIAWLISRHRLVPGFHLRQRGRQPVGRAARLS